MNIGNYSGLQKSTLYKQQQSRGVSGQSLSRSMEHLSTQVKGDTAPAEQGENQFLNKIQSIRTYSEATLYTSITENGSKDMLEALQQERGSIREGVDNFAQTFKTLQEKFQEIIDDSTFKGESVFSGEFSVSISFSMTIEGTVSPEALDFRPETLGLTDVPSDGNRAESLLNRAMTIIENQVSAQSSRLFDFIAQPQGELDAPKEVPAGEKLREMIQQSMESIRSQGQNAMLAQGNSDQSRVMALLS